MRILASRSVCHMSLHAPFCSHCRNLPVVYRTIYNTHQMRADYRQGTERTTRYRKFCAKILNFFGELFVLFYTLILGQNSRPLRALQSRNQYCAYYRSGYTHSTALACDGTKYGILPTVLFFRTALLQALQYTMIRLGRFCFMVTCIDFGLSGGMFRTN